MAVKTEKETAVAKNIAGSRIVMIDVDRVVSKSSLVKKLRAEHDKKNKELERWLKNVKKQVEKPDSKVVKDKLIKRYDEEFAKKKEMYAQEFKEKIEVVNKEVSQQILEIAKKNNLDIVLSKAVVVCGCPDMTELFEQNLK